MKHFFTISILLMLFAVSNSIAQTDWTKYPGNPILNPGPAGTWSDNSLLPACVIFDGSTYHMWFGGHDGTYGQIGYATSLDGITWSEYGSNPVLEIGSAGSWDDSRVTDPNVIFDGSIYHMWYGGYDGSEYAIGYATSPDRITWTKHAGNPVLTKGLPGSWMEKHVFGTCVLFDGSTYHMWFTGENMALRQCIGYASSSDRINWTPFTGNPVLTPSPAPAWDQQIVQGPDVVYDGNMYHMWFSGIDNTNWWEWQIGYATAPDETTWTKHVNNPIFTPTPGSWDSQWVGYGSVLLDTITAQYKMWYGGGSGSWNAKLGYATAPITINVPGDFATIQEAINAAHDGYIVLVDTGRYYENINFKGKAITVASHFYVDGDTSHISNTIIDGSNPSHPDSASVVYLISGEDTTSVLYGFTITNGTGTNSHYTWAGVQYPCKSGGGIFCWNSGGRFVSNKIINNTITGTEPFGGGLSTGDYGSNAWIILEHNKIINNTLIGGSFGTFGGGVGLCFNGKIIDNVLSYNSCISIGYVSAGGGMYIDTESIYPRTVYVEGNYITHNFVQGKGTPAQNNWAGQGGGIYNRNCKVSILDNEISYNKLTNVSNGNGVGGGIYMNQAANGSVISSNIISHDTSGCTGTNYGGGIGVGSGNGLSITNNIISGNYATQGGGIRVRENNAAIINNTIVNNTASTIGGGLHSYNSNPIIVNNILWDNQAPNNAGIDPSSLTRVRYSIVQGGYSGNGNLNIDPLLIPGDSLFNVNCTTDTSQCLNRGIDSVLISGTWYIAPETDFAGNPRPQPAGTRSDIGAWEYDVLNGLEEIQDNQIPLIFSLKQNYPNPFNPITTIEFSIPKTETVTLKIYNLIGQEVTSLVSEKLTTGEYKYKWDASHLASGVYFYKIEAGNFIQTRKLILMK